MKCFAFHGDRLLLHNNAIPMLDDIPNAMIRSAKIHRVTANDGVVVNAVAIEDIDEIGKSGEGWCLQGLRSTWEQIPDADHVIAGKCRQILFWHEHSRYCPVCGTPMEQLGDIYKKCPQCGNEMFPPVSTAIIVLVRRGDDEVLLVHARNFRGTFYGLVAGFLEAGETLEQCVAREVMEETGLTINNIRYIQSQSWPYPSQLMVGFVADYADGEIKLQDDELSAGAFYHRDNMPELPGKLSIARKLIEMWLNKEL